MIKNAVVRLHKLVTIPRSLIRRKLGEISEPVQQSVRQRLVELFDDA